MAVLGQVRRRVGKGLLNLMIRQRGVMKHGVARSYSAPWSAPGEAVMTQYRRAEGGHAMRGGGVNEA